MVSTLVTLSKLGLSHPRIQDWEISLILLTACRINHVPQIRLTRYTEPTRQHFDISTYLGHQKYLTVQPIANWIRTAGANTVTQ